MSNDTQPKFNIDENRPSDWFEPLYAESSANGEGVPWANMDTHPAFAQWLTNHELQGTSKTALVVGCGMGDDAIALEKLGYTVTAFDVSETAINFCKQRFPDSKVTFVQADLLQEQSQWQQAFDFVLEIYTVQALPPKFEQELIKNISNFVAPEGQLLVVAEVQQQAREFEQGPPWLLTPQHADEFVSNGLTLLEQSVGQGEEQFSGATTYVSLFKS